MDFAYSILLH